MSRLEKDKLRSSILFGNEVLKVEYVGDKYNFPKGVLEAISRFSKSSGLPYPLPKREACGYYIKDIEGDLFNVAESRYGEIHQGFKWVRE